MALTTDQIGFYQDNGYLLLEQAIPSNVLTSLRETVDRFIEASRAVEASNRIYDLDQSHSADNPRVRRLKDPHLRDPLFKQIAECSTIIDPVCELLGGTVRFDHSKLNFKHPGANAEINWHQDWAFYPHTNDDILAVGVLIEDCTPECGPLMVIPGSHKGPVFDHHHNGIFAGGVNTDAIGDLADKAVALIAPAGSLTIHHVRTLHASGNSSTNTLRPLLLFSYTAVDAFPIFSSYDLQEYDSRILRGVPVHEGRMAALPFRIHLPQEPGTDSIYDNQESMQR